MKLTARGVFVALLIASTATAAGAQSAPPPIGHWATSPPSEELYVSKNGFCAFLFRRKVQYQGSCTWDPTSRGGILTITYPMPLEPGKVRENVVWINRRTITIWGDVFHKQ